MEQLERLSDPDAIRRLVTEQVETERRTYAPEPEQVHEPEAERQEYADELPPNAGSPPADEQTLPPAPDIYTFPEGIMGGFADEFASILSSHLESAKHFFFFTVLTCMGLLFSCRVRLLSELKQQPRIYLVLLGESADDRKSTAISKATAFIDFMKDIFRDMYSTCDGAGSAEGLLKKFDNGIQRVLLLYDEFAVFISKAAIESSVLLPCVNTLFEQNKYENAISQKPIKVEDTHLSMIAACTIDTWKRIWTPTFTAIGFQNRLFLCPGKSRRQFAFPDKIPMPEKKRLKDLFKEIADWVGKDREIGITDDAKKIYEEWYLNSDRSVHSKRLDVYALRFMLLFCINERKEIIDADIATRVIRLMDWQLAVRKVLDPLDCDNKSALMEAKIRQYLTPPGTIKSERDIKRACHLKQAGYWIYNTSINNLLSAGEIIYASKAGAKHKRYRLNPDDILE